MKFNKNILHILKWEALDALTIVVIYTLFAAFVTASIEDALGVHSRIMMVIIFLLVFSITVVNLTADPSFKKEKKKE